MESITIVVNGHEYTLTGPDSLRAMRHDNFEDYYTLRTANKTILNWAFQLYLDELDAQDEKGSTGSYGKLNEVEERINYAIATGKRLFVHDIRCRRLALDDERRGDSRLEHKTSFAQWAYGHTEDEAWTWLLKHAESDIILVWDPFKDGRKIVMPLKDMLAYLASYNETKGLKVWFTFNKIRGQLQLQPVTNSKKRREWIEALL